MDTIASARSETATRSRPRRVRRSSPDAYEALSRVLHINHAPRSALFAFATRPGPSWFAGTSEIRPGAILRYSEADKNFQRSGSVTRMSLARTATLTSKGRIPDVAPVIRPLDGENLDVPLEDRVYASARGPVRRLRFPVTIERNPLFWEHPPEEPEAPNPVRVTLSRQRPK